jgi:molybdate transport system regulatory protein
MECSVSVRLRCSDAPDAIGFGKGIVMLLEGVEKYGSINQATHAMGMAYSKAWRILKATEKEFGLQLVERCGANGSRLTGDARKLIVAFHSLMDAAQNAAETELNRFFVQN